MKDEVKWHQKNLLRQVNLFGTLYDRWDGICVSMCPRTDLDLFPHIPDPPRCYLYAGVVDRLIAPNA